MSAVPAAPPFRRPLLISLATLLLLCLAIERFLFWIDEHNPTNDRPFQQKLWAQATERERVFMSHDLVQNYIKPGMSREQVLKLLGDRGASNEKDFAPNRSRLVYDLGAYSDLGYRGAAGVKVAIMFNGQQKVTEAYLDEY